jgi:hypothetical protein
MVFFGLSSPFLLFQDILKPETGDKKAGRTSNDLRPAKKHLNRLIHTYGAGGSGGAGEKIVRVSDGAVVF